MDFGICVASKIDDIDYIVHAERLGFSHAWVADSQMIWSDCFAVLGLAAERTSRIALGTGVAVSGTRLAPVLAHGIATVNRLARPLVFSHAVRSLSLVSCTTTHAIASVGGSTAAMISAFVCGNQGRGWRIRPFWQASYMMSANST